MTCVLCGAGKFSQDGAGKCSKCPAGQYVDTSGAEGCLACDLATFSFEGRTRACDSCPVGAKCVGGVLQGAKPGFWRQKHASELNNDSLRFYRCLTDSNCPNSDSSCLAHAIGPVCALCEEGYQKSATGCEPCDVSKDSSPVSVVAFTMAIFAIVAIIAVCLSQSCKRPAMFKANDLLTVSSASNKPATAPSLKIGSFFSSAITSASTEDYETAASPNDPETTGPACAQVAASVMHISSDKYYP